MDGRGVFARPERASATRGRVGTRARYSERARIARPTADDSGRREAEFGTSRDAPVRHTPGTTARSPRGRTPALSLTSSSRRPRSCGRSTVACAALSGVRGSVGIRRKKCAGKKCAFRGGGRGRFADRTNPLSGRVRFRPNRVINRRSGVESPDCGTDFAEFRPNADARRPAFREREAMMLADSCARASFDVSRPRLVERVPWTRSSRRSRRASRK